jgi:23S rRNA (uracil1939-C5)-methyltransferase
MRKPKKPLPILEKVLITDAGSEGKAIARVGEMVVFLPFVVPGDVVDIQVTRSKRNFMEGKAIKFHEYSDKRTDPFCSHFGLCGGCKWQCMDYTQQLVYKQKQVTDAFDRIGKLTYSGFNPIIPSRRIQEYRNKLEYTFSNRRWLHFEEGQLADPDPEMRGLGFHLPTMFDRVLDVKRCYLQAEPSNSIRLAIREFSLQRGWTYYDPRNHCGFLRNLVIRTSSRGAAMAIVVFGEEDFDAINELMTYVKTTFPELYSLFYIINTKKNDTYSDLEPVLFAGAPFLDEYIEDLTFRIGPLSFYQVNTEQSYELYKYVRDFASLSGKEIVYDLYTGTGTIALFLARNAAKVVGIEYVEAAILDADANSFANGISNATFVAGDIAKTLTPEFVAIHGKPDVIVTDPPRAGMHEKVIEQIIAIRPERLVYVSCNPATQARDLALLKEFYDIVAVQPVDMFPHTQHVENVILAVAKV